MGKVFISFVCMLFYIGSLFANSAEEQQEPYRTYKFAASAIKDVLSETSGGSISVDGSATSEAIVQVFVSRNNWTNEKIKKVLEENYTLKVNVEGEKLIVTAKNKKSSFNWSDSGLSISFKISVPQKTNTKLNTSGGSIRIANLSGFQDFSTSGGSLTVENVSGKTKGRTSGGSINISGSKDDIDLATSGGSIKAKQSSGNIRLNTSGGSINLSGLDGSIQVETSGGSITVDNITGTLKTSTSGGSINLSAISGDLDASTAGGNLTAEIKSVNKYVKLSNSGNIRLKLPQSKGYNLKVRAERIQTPGLTDFRGSRGDDYMDGTVGNGGPSIEVRTSQKAEISFGN